jgi:uncharacterized protein YllA (UPF0747 family)
MKTKHLSKEETLKLIDLIQKRIDFNNRLNKTARNFMKENNIVNFNGYHDEPTYEMINTLEQTLNQETWMPEQMKREYLEDASAIFGGTYSVAVNTYVRKDLQDLESHLKEIDTAVNKAEETYEEFGFKVVRDVEDTRMNLFFDDIPDENIRNLLKSNGFKWSPNLKAWTRQLTQNAEYSLNRLLNQLAGHI